MDIGKLEELALAGFFAFYNTSPRLDLSINNQLTSGLSIKNAARLCYEDTRDSVKEYLKFLKVYFN
jgi:serine protease inhibitor